MADDRAIDDLDARIVDALAEDSRASLRSIACDLGVAASTVSTRLRRLESSGAVRGYRPTIDYGAFGYPVTAIVRLRTTGTLADGAGGVADGVSDGRTDRPDAAADAGPFDDPLWTDVHRVTGRFDFVSIGRFRDTAAVADAVDGLRSLPSVAAVETDLVIETVRDGAPLPLS